MQLTVDVVFAAFRLLGNERLSEREARTHLRLLGTREELLAHLILKRGAFDSLPKLRERLSAIAQASSVVTQTPRQETGDLLRKRQLSDAVRMATARAIDSDIGNRTIFDEIEKARLLRARHDPEITAFDWPAQPAVG